MSGGTRWAKPAVARPLDGWVRRADTWSSSNTSRSTAKMASSITRRPSRKLANRSMQRANAAAVSTGTAPTRPALRRPLRLTAGVAGEHDSQRHEPLRRGRSLANLQAIAEAQGPAPLEVKERRTKRETNGLTTSRWTRWQGLNRQLTRRQLHKTTGAVARASRQSGPTATIRATLAPFGKATNTSYAEAGCGVTIRSGLHQ
jgi:hypothetical protein